MNQKSQAREAEEFRRVAEIVLGRALEGRDSLAIFGTAERAKSSPAQAGQTARKFSLMPGGVLKLTGRAIDIAQDAYRGAVAQMKRLSGRENADTEADALEAMGTERKTPGEKLAAVAAAHQERARQAAEEEKAMDGTAREVAETQARAAAQEAAKRQPAEDPRLKAEEIPVSRQKNRRARRLKGSQNRMRKSKAERAEADLAQERALTRELEQQLSILQNDQKLLAQERARIQELEQQLSIRQNDQKLLAQERARIQELEQQLSIRQNDQKLLAQERARTQELEPQQMARGDEQKLPAQQRARTQELQQQLLIRHNDQKVLAPEAPGNLEAARLMEQAHVLLDQGNIIAARSVLERAAQGGNALALFLLAETYDPASLSAWGIFSTGGIFRRRGDVTKAQELYAKAVARGVREAKYRLSALR
jgi:hypothetical protein